MDDPAQTLKELMSGLNPKPTIAVAESLTAGNLQALIASVSGASEYFLGGLTAYSIEEKQRILGLDEKTLLEVNAVSEPVALMMAHSAAGLFGSDIAASTTGYAEPSVEQGVDKPFAWWALVWKNTDGVRRQKSGRIVCEGMSRTAVQSEVARHVLSEIVELVKGISR